MAYSRHVVLGKGTPTISLDAWPWKAQVLQQIQQTQVDGKYSSSIHAQTERLWSEAFRRAPVDPA